jgi:hypothetical protein
VRRALKLTPEDVNGMARAVNVFHLAGDRDEALRWLKSALDAGYGLTEFERDPDLRPLRADVRYLKLIESFQAAQRARSGGSPDDREPGRNTQGGDVA